MFLGGGLGWLVESRKMPHETVGHKDNAPESVTVGHSVSWGTFVFGFPTALKLMLTKCIGFCDIHATERATSRGN